MIRAFQEWCKAGMPEDPKEFYYGAIVSDIAVGITIVLQNYIFCAEFQKFGSTKV
ncbi:MAG: hypothetical protein KME40_21275 [Komarekiella atlantica HA4396-MV6]|jgi:hypothetical protein|nr:hypothetical protein [Komarekiella atlantica HA4396-MV6]